jgi:hypothetical protein
MLKRSPQITLNRNSQIAIGFVQTQSKQADHYWLRSKSIAADRSLLASCKRNGALPVGTTAPYQIHLGPLASYNGGMTLPIRTTAPQLAVAAETSID